MNLKQNLSGMSKGEGFGCNSSQQDCQPEPCLVVPEEGSSSCTGQQVGSLPAGRADIWPGSQPAVRPRWIRSIAGHRLDYSRLLDYRLFLLDYFRLQIPFFRQSCHICVMLALKTLICCQLYNVNCKIMIHGSISFLFFLFF